MNSEHQGKGRQRLWIRDLVLLSLFALISIAARRMLHLPIRVSGHAYVPYLILLVFAGAYINKRGAVTYMGLVAGLFGVASGSDQGLFGFFRLFLPALAMEGFRLIRLPLPGIVLRVIEGLVAAGVMLAVKSLVNWIMGQPLEIVLAKTAPGLVFYTIFGVVSGVVAHLLLQMIRIYKRK